jgi:hypothetical protein
MISNLSEKFWEHIEQNKDKKFFQSVYNWLNKDNLGFIILEDNVFWIEKTCSNATLPNYIYNYIKKWGKSLGYKYLYDLEKI